MRDLNSTNGTFAGGLRLFEAEIPMGTVLRVGETELLFEPAPQGQQEPSFHGLVGKDPAMRQLVEFIRRVAPSNAVVTVLGESGTGKEMVAQALHEASPRAGQPFVEAIRTRGVSVALAISLAAIEIPCFLRIVSRRGTRATRG